ncbi:hypothetical protein B0H10DRAFT_1948646 [Mycena sp. CBHHK59/15]|nr:hypothetical protein B0H10DRAFT_1948646 [Mycena sp. CBHHK59/15]
MNFTLCGTAWTRLDAASIDAARSQTQSGNRSAAVAQADGPPGSSSTKWAAVGAGHTYLAFRLNIQRSNRGKASFLFKFEMHARRNSLGSRGAMLSYVPTEKTGQPWPRVKKSAKSWSKNHKVVTLDGPKHLIGASVFMRWIFVSPRHAGERGRRRRERAGPGAAQPPEAPARDQKREISVRKIIFSNFKVLARGIPKGPSYCTLYTLQSEIKSELRG